MGHPVARLLVCALAAASVTACSRARPPDPGSEGARLYTANCSECHGVDGGGLKAGSLRGGFSAEDVSASLATSDHGTIVLTDDDVRVLAEYVASMHAAGASG